MLLEVVVNTTFALVQVHLNADKFWLGMNLPQPGSDQAPTLVFAVGSRVVMNWAGAKRLALSLGQVVRQFEERNGEINIGQQRGQGPRMSQ